MAQVVEHILGKDEVGSSSLPNSSKKSRSSERDFFIQADRLGISSCNSVYIIKCDKSHLYLITPLGVHKKPSA